MAMELQREQMITLDKLELSIRHGFVRKVMGLLVLEICIVMAVVCLFVYTPGIVLYINANRWTLYASILALFVALCCSSTCCTDVARVFPQSLFLCAGVALIAGVFLGVFSIYLGLDQNNSTQIWIAFGTTTGVMSILGIFAMQTRYDFSGIGPYLSISCLVILMFALLGAFMSYVGGLLWIGLIVTLLAMYVVYDMQLVLGGKHRRYQFTVDDAPLASLALFTDFVMIFAVLLALGEGR